MKFGAKTLMNAVALIVVLPLPIAVTFVVAAVVGLNDTTPGVTALQTHGWLGIVVPPESSTMQLAVTERPIVAIGSNELGFSTADAGNCRVRRSVESFCPSISARILTTIPVWLDAVSDCARPPASMLMIRRLVDHTGVFPGIANPPASRASAEKRSVSPTKFRSWPGGFGDITTVATA